MKNLRAAVALICGAGSALSAPVWAQGVVASGTSDADTGQLTEIVVTAEKREENLQKTPIDVTVVNQDALTRAGVHNFDDINKLLPEVQVNFAFAATIIQIRGVRPNDFGPTSEPPNAVHIDGAYLSRPTALQGDFFDIDRVEVLAGPQGTLYGRNSAGGTINIITAKPNTHDFGGYAEVEAGNYNLVQTNAALNLPLSDTFAVRLAGRRYRHDGYYVDTGEDDADQTSGRAEALWTPTDGQRLLVTTDVEKTDGKGTGSNIVSGSPNIVLPSDQRHNQADAGDADNTALRSRAEGYMAQYDYDLPFATLTAQGSYRDLVLNTSGGTLGLTPQEGWLQTALVPGAGIGRSSSRWDTEEVRMSSLPASTQKWVVGLFRFGERSVDGQMINFAPGTTIPAFQIANPLEVARSYAAFGQTTLTPDFNDRLHLTLGARYTYDHKMATGFTALALPVINSSFDDSAHWDAFTYKANLAYDLTSTSEVYGGVSTGYKAGGYAYGTTPKYNPEHLTAFEVGSKNRFFDNTLQVNISAWLYHYKDFETTIAVPAPPPVNFDITVRNAGKAQIYGSAVAVDYLVTKDDQLGAAITFLNAEYENFDLTSQGGSNYSNTTMGYSPRFSGNLSYDHFFRTAIGVFDAQAAMQFNTRRLLDNQAVPGSTSYIVGSSYETEDLSMRYAPNVGNWSVTGYGHNLTNRLTETGSSYNSNAMGPFPGTYFYTTRSYGPPRTFGVIFDVKF